MTTRRDPDRLIHAFLLEGQTELADPVYYAVRANIERRRQRVVIGPWRTPVMNKSLAVGLGAAAVIAALVVGARFLAPPGSSGVGGAPPAGPSATAAPSAQPSAGPTPSPMPPSSPSAATPPPLTQTFNSLRHGISVTTPEGWTARGATEPWTDRPDVPHYSNPGMDVLEDPVMTDHLFLSFASRPIGDSTPEDWVATLMAGCTASESITVDGAPGLIGTDCNEAAVATAGRGYWIGLYTNYREDPATPTSYDRAWFEQVLATVRLQPEDAVDVAPSATP